MEASLKEEEERLRKIKEKKTVQKTKSPLEMLGNNLQSMLEESTIKPNELKKRMERQF